MQQIWNIKKKDGAVNYFVNITDKLQVNVWGKNVRKVCRESVRQFGIL